MLYTLKLLIRLKVMSSLTQPPQTIQDAPNWHQQIWCLRNIRIAALYHLTLYSMLQRHLDYLVQPHFTYQYE